MQVYRLSRERYSSELNGKGAALRGARWNSPGIELIYTASNRSLAMAEVAVHFTLATLPDDYMMVTIHVPDNIQFTILEEAALPDDWKNFPHSKSTQLIGDTFVRANQFCLMMVPSVVTKGDFNWLINPNHPDFKDINIVEVEKFPFDKKLILAP